VILQQNATPAAANIRPTANPRKTTVFSVRLGSGSDNGNRRGPKIAHTSRPPQPNTHAATIQEKIRARLDINEITLIEGF